MAKFKMELPTELINQFKALADNSEKMIEEMTEAGANVVYNNVIENMQGSFKDANKLRPYLKITRTYKTPSDDGINTKVGFYGYYKDKTFTVRNNMNELIEQIFNNFIVNGVVIPVSFLRYGGKSTTYITYTEWDKSNSYSGDDEILGYVSYYDFDVFSKGNYLEIVKAVKEIMKENGFTWQPSRDSQDMFEDDTGYYHKTLCFAIERGNE